MRRMLLRSVLATAVTATVGLLAAGPAVACGSLIGPNGAVNLVRTSTLAAYHRGIEHYVTSFQFASPKESFGSIVPLPAAPTKVERGGDWTLQRLEREVAPPFAPEDVRVASASQKAEVVSTTRIDALDVTILKGGGASVAQWAAQQGFELSADAPAVLDFYARRSRYFMAARYDAKAAVARGLTSGDGTPVHLTIPVDNPWVPLRILATGKSAGEVVDADVFLLTDREPAILSGPGLVRERSKEASTELLADLRADTGMNWMPPSMWLTYLRVEKEATGLRADLAIDASGRGRPRVADTGVASLGALGVTHVPATYSSWLIAVVLAAFAAVVWLALAVLRMPTARA